MPKDLFSTQSDSYARYRPGYPRELFDYIFQFVEQKNRAWDCATGNGQAATILAEYVAVVDASDISEAQISNAVKKENIRYHICSAEQTPFEQNSFDLITVAQAYHWINWELFHREASRVGKPNCVVAIWTYNLARFEDEALNRLLYHFYKNITGPYWDAARKYVDEEYKSVAFDFDPLPSKEFSITLHWKRENLVGFLQSWSAVQHYIKKNGTSPLALIENDLVSLWPAGEIKTIYFPIFLRMGRIVK
ncbi:MAG: class I SAM-dependent methyltransferase [Flavisolibacter sp.]|jgi:ubiquinone/menaquinone biosynthesis C-methylase UbiE